VWICRTNSIRAVGRIERVYPFTRPIFPLYCEGGWEDCVAVPTSGGDCVAVLHTRRPGCFVLTGGSVSCLLVYLLYLDESGTHGGSPAFILAGLAIHEDDAWYFQQKLQGVLVRKLPKGLRPRDFELHAAEIKSPIKMVKGIKVVSPWAQVPYGTRLDIMRGTVQAISSYDCQDAAYPYALFGAVVDRTYKDREQRAYEEVLHKFDEMLTRQGNASGKHQRGLVVHDRRVIERDVQTWTATWREVSGRIGKLTHFTDVPLFADSRASRLIQAADFVSWSLWRNYGPSGDATWAKPLWSEFDNADGVMHGLIHVVPGFNQGACNCPPCHSRQQVASAT
jgi:hypothetical protein